MRFLYACALLCSLFLPRLAQAQRINFSTFVQGEGLLMNIVQNTAGLNFSSVRPIFVGDPQVTSIGLMDQFVVVLQIEGPLEYDLLLELTSPAGLGFGGVDTGVRVPFDLRFAYNNTGESDDNSRRSSAIEVPGLYRQVQLPMRARRAGGPPPPPPTPMHGGFVRPRGSVYVYLYGHLGPVPAGIRSGLYSGEIVLNVSYADNL